MFLFVNFIFIAVFCILLSLVIYKYFTANITHWKDRKVAYKKPIFGFGSIKDHLLGRASIGEIYQKIYNEYPSEKYVGCFLSTKPDLMIRDPELIKCVLVKDFHCFQDRIINFSDRLEKLNGNLFFAQGAKWKLIRQKMTPVFSSVKLKYMFHLVVEKAEEFQRFLDTKVAIANDQEVRELFGRFTMDIIGSCAFGIQMNSMSDSETVFLKMVKKLFAGSVSIFLKNNLRFLNPKLYDFLNLRILDKEIEHYFMSSMKDIIHDRINNNTKRRDLVDLMLDLKSKKYIDGGENIKEAIEVSDTFITCQAFVFILAGYETSASVMTFALYELVKNPSVQEKVINEIDLVLKKHDGKLSYDAIAEMNYLECVIFETMRKYPVLGTLRRYCSSEYTFPGTDLVMKKGDIVSIPIYGLHYDPQYFPEPEKFIPERFTSEANQKRHPMVYLPFGEGPRICIGSRFGKMQSMIGLVAVLTKYTVHECSKTSPKIILSPLSFTTASKNGVWIKMKPRCDGNQ